MSGSAEWIQPADVEDHHAASGPENSRLRSEERANQITHGIGFLLSLAGVTSLLRVAWSSNDPRVVYGCTIYSAALVLVFATSLLSHTFENGRTRDLFRLLDQVCIYFLIAGTVTPMALAFWSPSLLLTLLAGTWLMAIVGVVRKIFVEGPDRVTLWVYVAIGWFPAMGTGPTLARLPTAAGVMLVVGGLSFTIGTYFWLREGRIPYSHAVWHLFVLVGTATHFAVIRWYVAEGAVPGSLAVF